MIPEYLAQDLNSMFVTLPLHDSPFLTRDVARLLRLLLFVGAALALPACGGGGYTGYKDAPYTVKGQRYHPMGPPEAVGYEEVGTASHYKGGFSFFPGKTAIGEKIYPWSHGAAHKTLPLPCRVRITNLENGRRVKVRVNDRGPFIPGRIIDVTAATAKQLGFHDQGLTEVRVEVLSVGDGKYRIR
jgi:rare lipoprotein A